MTDLQSRVAAYHRLRFPTAGPENVALKIAEEAGEVASAVNGYVSGGDYGKGDTVDEVVDVVLACLALAGRWFPERNVLAEVEARLERFLDPNGGHRSCVKVRTMSGWRSLSEAAMKHEALVERWRGRLEPTEFDRAVEIARTTVLSLEAAGRWVLAHPASTQCPIAHDTRPIPGLSLPSVAVNTSSEASIPRSGQSQFGP